MGPPDAKKSVPRCSRRGVQQGLPSLVRALLKQRPLCTPCASGKDLSDDQAFQVRPEPVRPVALAQQPRILTASSVTDSLKYLPRCRLAVFLKLCWKRET